MAAIPNKYNLIIILAFVIFCNCESDNPSVCSSCAKLQILPDTLSSMKYGNFRIQIYEHVNNHKATTSEKKYFYSPLALLDHKSAVCIYNKVTKQPEMRFRIEMWNDKVENEVVKHLNDIVGHEIKSNKVAVIPLKNVILASKRPTQEYSLSSEWTSYDKSKTLRLSLSCYDQKICDELANEMQSLPEQFDHLKLLYSLSSQTSQTKQAVINIDSITSGQMVSNLFQKFGDKDEIFLTANDKKKMLTETATNIRMDIFDDSEVASPDTEIQIYNILKDLLVTSRATIKDESDKMWDSVFWNEDNYRPDRTTKTLNEIISKLDKETQKILADMFQKKEKKSEITEKFTSSNKDVDTRREEQYLRENQTKDANENERSIAATHQYSRHQIDKWVLATNYSNTDNTSLGNKERIQHNYDANSWADVDRISSTISGKLSNDSDSTDHVEILKEDVEKLLQESRNHVQWDGEKFVPKTLQLSKINLDKFRDSQSFQDRKVRVRYINAELSAQIKFMEHAELTVVNEWNNLKDELKATTDLLNTTVMELVRTSTELSDVKRDLAQTNNTLEGTKQELEKTKIELEKTRANLGKNVDDLSRNINTTENEMEIRTGNLSTELKGTKQELEKTRANVNSLSTKLIVTEKELVEMKIRVVNLSTELKTNSQRLGHEIKIAEDNLKKELRANLNQLETTTASLASARTELSSTKSAVSDLTKKFNERTGEIVDIGKMPTSCSDLQRMGHKLSGFFSVKGSKKMEMVYCDLYPNKNDKEKWIGYTDVKSAPVHFYVQRNSALITGQTSIPFQVTRLNEGNAMNLTSGKFTTLRPGIHFFSFTGVVRFSVSTSTLSLRAGLYFNGVKIAESWVKEGNTADGQRVPFTVQATLNLKKGDQVWVQIHSLDTGVSLYDDGDLYTHFTGSMLDEEIAASF